MAELNKLLASGDSEWCETGEEKQGAPPDSDTIIIMAYEAFAARLGRKVVLFSSDNEFVLRSTNRINLVGQLVRYPAALVDLYESSWGNVCRLLYQLSIVYGRLDISLGEGNTIRLYGVWQEKGANDWEQECTRLAVDNTSPKGQEFYKTVARNKAILEGVS